MLFVLGFATPGAGGWWWWGGRNVVLDPEAVSPLIPRAAAVLLWEKGTPAPTRSPVLGLCLLGCSPCVLSP